MPKLPYIALYTGDWLRDHVAGCSLTAQGLWLRMMIVMHDCERYGYLSLNGSPIPPDAIARKCGCDSLVQYETLLAELDLAGVPSRTDSGVIYSRRMVRDAKKRADGALRSAKFRNADVTPNDSDNENWIRELGKEPCYSHVKVRDEMGKMLIWCRLHSKTPTRKRLIAWLNRIERPMQGAALAARPAPVKEIPDQMRTWLIEHYNERREQIQQWQTMDHVPPFLRDEWFRYRKEKKTE